MDKTALRCQANMMLECFFIRAEDIK